MTHLKGDIGTGTVLHVSPIPVPVINLMINRYQYCG
jgi:hypothetical protein